MNNEEMEEMDRVESLYGPKDQEYQIACVGYMYGEPDTKRAKSLMSLLSEEKIAEAMDYFSVRDLPMEAGQRHV